VYSLKPKIETSQTSHLLLCCLDIGQSLVDIVHNILGQLVLQPRAAHQEQYVRSVLTESPTM
jgi:hypothetical protein